MGIAGATAADALDAISAATPDDATFSALASRVRGGEKLLFKDDSPEHITASYLVFDSALHHVLLQFHTKGQFWIQFGGTSSARILRSSLPPSASWSKKVVWLPLRWSRRNLWTSTCRVWATGSACVVLTSICSSPDGPPAPLAPR